MFDINKIPEFDDGDWDESEVSQYCEDLFQAFAESPEGEQAQEKFEGVGWTTAFLDYAFSYLGVAPSQMSRADVNKILFELFPRKVSTKPETASVIVGELRLFFEYLDREHSLPNAKEILQDLTKEAASQLESAMSDSSNFGIAKSMVMGGRAAGFDMSSQEGLAEFMQAYNSSIAQQHGDTDLKNAEPPAESVGYASQGHSEPRMPAMDRKQRKQLLRKKLGKSKRR